LVEVGGGKKGEGVAISYDDALRRNENVAMTQVTAEECETGSSCRVRVPVVCFPAASYSVGCTKPLAYARRVETLRTDAPFVIDVKPVTWRLFEVFVSYGGYADERFWPQGTIVCNSVDARCVELLDLRKHLGALSPSLDSPIVGLTWRESVALAGFFGARLPTELEWEIVAGSKYNSGQHDDDLIEEWTCDTYSSSEIGYGGRTERWSGDSSPYVVVRGSSSCIHDRRHCRRGIHFDTLDFAIRPRGCRRVWPGTHASLPHGDFELLD
jgi:formylglycine-generating enzyme required for sulfatase activity